MTCSRTPVVAAAASGATLQRDWNCRRRWLEAGASGAVLIRLHGIAPRTIPTEGAFSRLHLGVDGKLLASGHEPCRVRVDPLVRDGEAL